VEPTLNVAAMKLTPRLRDLPEDWLNLPAFEAGGRSVVFREIVQAAAVRGDLDPFLEQTIAAWRAQTEALNSGLEAEESSVEALMEEYRYDRDLVSAEETERWLAQWGLTPEDFLDHFVRRYWAGVHRNGTANEAGSELIPDGFGRIWLADMVLSGVWVRWARQLATEVVCGLATEPTSGDAVGVLLEGFKRKRTWSEPTWEQWLADWELHPDQLAEILRRLEITERRQREALSPSARESVVDEQRMALVRVDLEVVGFDSEEAAKEGYSCAVSDGLSLELVARESGYPMERRAYFLRDLPDGLKMSILGAYPGAILPPHIGGGTVDVYRVVRHTEPDLADPHVAGEIDAILIQRHFGDLEAREVRWLMTGGAST
jgi:hypothetical protein